MPVTDEGSYSASWLTRVPAGTNVLIAMSDAGARFVPFVTPFAHPLPDRSFCCRVLQRLRWLVAHLHSWWIEHVVSLGRRSRRCSRL